jgi:hypothetical protein
MNDAFPTAHPKLPAFIETIRRKSDEYVTRLRLIADRFEAAPRHEPANVYERPADYDTFDL